MEAIGKILSHYDDGELTYTEALRMVHMLIFDLMEELLDVR